MTMPKRENSAITVEGLKDPKRAHEIYRRTDTAVPVKSNKRGDDLARFVPEAAYEPDFDRPAVIVPLDIFRDQPTRFAHAASMGHAIKVVAETGLSFVLLPPTRFRGNVSPTSLGCWWVAARRHSVSERQPADPINLTQALIEVAARLGAMENRLDTLGVKRRARRKGTGRILEDKPRAI
jgi:hypothetical protein